MTSSRYWRSISTSPRKFMKYSALRHMGEVCVAMPLSYTMVEASSTRPLVFKISTVYRVFCPACTRLGIFPCCDDSGRALAEPRAEPIGARAASRRCTGCEGKKAVRVVARRRRCVWGRSRRQHTDPTEGLPKFFKSKKVAKRKAHFVVLFLGARRWRGARRSRRSKWQKAKRSGHLATYTPAPPSHRSREWWCGQSAKAGVFGIQPPQRRGSFPYILHPLHTGERQFSSLHTYDVTRHRHGH